MIKRNSARLVGALWVAAFALTGCFGQAYSTPSYSDLTGVDFQDERQIVAFEFSQYQAIQDFDTSTFRIEDSVALTELENLLIMHGVREYEPALGDDEIVAPGALTMTLEYEDLSGDTFTLDVGGDGSDFEADLVAITSGWRETIPALYEGGDEIASITVENSHSGEVTDVTDADARDALGTLMREHGIMNRYEAPSQLNPPTLGLPDYFVGVVLEDGTEIELTLSPAAPSSAEFSREAIALVQTWLV